MYPPGSLFPLGTSYSFKQRERERERDQKCTQDVLKNYKVHGSHLKNTLD
jgi:hypothetical protein